MREIKFRAYIKKDKKIVEVKSLHLGSKKIIIGYSKSKTNYGNYSITFDEIELMQYTGLHDKNGKEIYENMIINNEYIVVYDFCKFVLKNIKNGDITDFKKDGVYEITREYFE